MLATIAEFVRSQDLYSQPAVTDAVRAKRCKHVECPTILVELNAAHLCPEHESEWFHRSLSSELWGVSSLPSWQQWQSPDGLHLLPPLLAVRLNRLQIPYALLSTTCGSDPRIWSRNSLSCSVGPGSSGRFNINRFA